MPDWKSELRSRLSPLKLAPVREAEIIDELAQHLDDRYAELLAGGATADDAARAALAELSDHELLAQELEQVEQPVNQEPVVLGAGRANMIADFWQDLRYAARSLRKHAGLSIAVIATLMLGIGISTGVFTYYNAQFLRARVDQDFASFARVYSAYTTDPLRPGRPGGTTLEDYLAYRDQAKSLRDIAAWADFYSPLGKDDPDQVRTLLVTENFFSLYDLKQPLMGRLLQPEDFSAATPVAVLSEPLWRNRFAADPQIIGRVVRFNGQPVTVVGVTPIFAGMVNNARAWFPYTLETYLKHGDDLQRPGEAAWLNVAGRLNPGFSHQQAAAELKLLASQPAHLHPGRTTLLEVTDGSPIQMPGARDEILSVLAVIVGVLVFLVLIVSLNVTTLLLSRAAGRRQEIAVRLALGAGRGRLIRMLLTETFLLAAMAGLLSVLLAYRMPDLLMRWLSPADNLDTWSLAPDWRAFIFLTLMTVLAGAMAGLTPALQSLKVNLSEMLKGRSSTPSGARRSWLYGSLIGAQIALSFFLLYGTGFCLRAYRQATTGEPGFETRQILWTGLFMQRGGNEPRNWEGLHRTLATRIAALPGVQAVAYAKRLPYLYALTTEVQTPGQALRQVAINWVSANYFDTLGIAIVSGRALHEEDRPCTSAAEKTICSVVVSQRFAREFWPGENPLGQTLRNSAGNSFEVVGVARDLSSTRLGQVDDPMIYQPLDLQGTYPPHPFVRFSGEVTVLARAITAAARELAPELEVKVQTIESKRAEMMEALGRDTQFIALLCTLPVILAIIGVYGVVATAVSQRAKEMGIRIALGAQKKDIYVAVLGSSGRPIAIGLLIGLALTLATWSTMAQILQNVGLASNVQDPITYILTALLLVGVALAAMLIPARRATRIDPMVALREE